MKHREILQNMILDRSLPILGKGGVLFSEIPTGTGKTKLLLDAGFRLLESGRPVVIATSSNHLVLEFLKEAEKFGHDRESMAISIGRENYLSPVMALDTAFIQEFELSRQTVEAWIKTNENRLLVDLFLEAFSLPEEASEAIKMEDDGRDMGEVLTRMREGGVLHITNHYYLIYMLMYAARKGQPLDIDILVDETHLLPNAAATIFSNSFSPFRMKYLIRRLLLSQTFSGAMQKRLAAAAEKCDRLIEVAQSNPDIALNRLRELGSDAGVKQLAKDIRKLPDESSHALTREISELYATSASGRQTEVVFSTVRRLPTFSVYQENPIGRLRLVVSHHIGAFWGVSGTLRISRETDAESNRWSFERCGFYRYVDVTEERHGRHNRRTLNLRFDVHPSPFSREQMRYIVLDDERLHPPKPEEGRKAYERWVGALAEEAKVFFESIRRSGVVLMSSFENTELFVEKLAQKGVPDGFDVFAYTYGTNLRRLIALYKARIDAGEPALLVGGLPLFTGIDLSGKYLEGLFVGKLPFEPKSDYFTRRRYGSFSSQADMVKKALMTFRQGMGRAIRSENDRAVVLVADPRIKSARYGDFLYFLDSAGIGISANLRKAS